MFIEKLFILFLSEFLFSVIELCFLFKSLMVFFISIRKYFLLEYFEVFGRYDLK